ncbi:MAG: 1-acyl-sn-glycerol-3-phosphate acyltransferase [Rhodothermaceae bacterium]|nr:1-acyl-sn-glycerol-3-phosphate acyltransferase [Rhodothermaceae bacterium]
MAERIDYVRLAPVHEPSVLGILLGVLRFAVATSVVIVGAVAVLLTALVPVRIRGARLSLWIVVGLCRLFVVLFGIRLRCTDPEALRQHRGLVFINHLSYLDPLIIEAVAPTRFLSTAGVRALPFIGWIAQSIGTVFVNRGNDESRSASREAVVRKLRTRATPPITIAPEGQIGPGYLVLPFRHGAFEIAAEAGVPILPVVLQFEPLDTAAWVKGEWIPKAVWRLAARTATFTATLTPLAPIQPAPDDNIAALASATEAHFNAVLAADPTTLHPVAATSEP